MTRCLLAQSGLPTYFWAEAVNTANYIRNRCISKSLNGSTLYELWKGEKPDISHLQSFGCKVLLLDKSPSKGKLEPRATEGIFIGYADTSKGYRVWIPKDRKVVVTRDIKFLSEFHATNNHSDLTKETSDDRKDVSLSNDTYTFRDLSGEIAGSDVSTTHQPPDEPGNDIVDAAPEQREDDVDPPNDENTESEEPPPMRGPGRPRKVLTGKPGRPAKQFHPKKNDSATEPIRDHEKGPRIRRQG